MSKSHILLTLLLCCALLLGCAGRPEPTTAPATAIGAVAADDTATPSATGTVAAGDTATPAATGTVAAGDAATPATTGAVAAGDTATPAAEKPTATATSSQPTAAHTATPEASGYAGGRLGFADDYISFPDVAAQAAALDYDPARIFAFVRDEIDFESYPGILRGPLGTLWGRAGNAADQAALLYALLRESGFEAQFAQGTLPRAEAQTLLQTLFTPVLESALTGVEPSGRVADPLNDPALLAETAGHLWVQMFAADGWLDLDPAFPGAQMGDRHTEPTATFGRPPDEWYHRLSIRVRLERITPDGLKLTYPLEYQGRVADLVGQRVEFRHALEAMGSQGGMEAAEIGRVIAAGQRRYQPVLRLGDTGIIGELFTEAEGLDLDAPVGRIAGALGNEGEEAGPLSGEWLEFTLTFPDGTQETFERAVFDRLGPSARATNDLDRLLRLDMNELLLGTHLSILIAPCRIPTDVARAKVEAILGPLMVEHENLQQHLAARRVEGIESEIREFVLDSMLPYDTRLWVEMACAVNMMMASASDDALHEAASLLAVERYYDSPRVIITSLTELAGGGTAFGLDLRRDSIRVLAHPGQDKMAEQVLRAQRGVLDGALEGIVLEGITGRPAITAPAVFAAAEAQGIDLVSLSPGDRAALDGLALPKDARARISRALESGYSVAVPQRFVTLDASGSEPRVAWWRIDPATGETVAVMDTGLHQGMTFWDNVVLNMYLGQLGKICKNCSTEPVDVLVGFDQTLINYAGNVFKVLTPEKPWADMKSEALAATGAQVTQTIAELITAGASVSAAMYTLGAIVAIHLID